MAIQTSASDATSYIRRSTSINYNSAYTVLFRYYSTGSHSGDFLWGISGTTGSGTGSYPSSSYLDRMRFVSGGALWIDVLNSGSASVVGTSLASGWHSIAVVRTNVTTIKMRIDGTNYTGTTSDVTGREASAYEFMLAHANSSSEGVPVGSFITNYKSWTSALSDAEIDAEMLNTTFTVTSNKFSGSPMGDAATLAGNLTATDSGTTWTAGAGVTYGANDGSVNYGSSTKPAFYYAQL